MIPAFEPFYLVQNRWSETMDVVGKVGEDVKLRFSDDAVGIDRSPDIKDIGDGDFEICL